MISSECRLIIDCCKETYCDDFGLTSQQAQHVHVLLHLVNACYDAAMACRERQ